MVLMLILHVFRVYLTGGFKRPRELTWVTGVVMAVITVAFGVTGYSLPWDQVGYWAVKIVSGVTNRVIEKYGIDLYTEQRVKWMEDSVESLLENDKVTIMTLGDFI